MQCAGLGSGAYATSSGPLDYIKLVVEAQHADGADYIAVNLDAFGENDSQVTIDMMVEYVRLVRRWGGGVPICIDSSHRWTGRIFPVQHNELHNTIRSSYHSRRIHLHSFVRCCTINA